MRILKGGLYHLSSAANGGKGWSIYFDSFGVGTGRVLDGTLAIQNERCINLPPSSAVEWPL